MKMVCVPILLALALTVAALPLSPAEEASKKEAGAASGALAKKLVTQCARVKDGDIVQISGAARDVQLLENLAVEAAKVGGDTLITLAPSDETARRLYTDVPAKYDSRTPTARQKLAETVTVMIAIDSIESEAAFADIPPERVNARTEVSIKVMDTLLKRNVRQVYVGNGLYPTEKRAKEIGITRAELTKLYHDGLNVDYDKLHATGAAVRKALAGGKKVHITTPEGTDVAFDVADRTAYVSDGILSDEKVKKGGAACQSWLPAGEVYLVPVAGTAEGKVVVEKMLWEGKEIEGLSLTFKKGKLTEMKAKSGLARLQALYDAAGAGKDEFSFLDLGINPAVRLPKSSPAGLYMEAGTITIGTGTNVWAGGDNKSPFGITCYLRGGTLHLDDKALVQDGALEIPR